MNGHEDVENEEEDLYMRHVLPESRKLTLHIVLLRHGRFRHLWRCRHRFRDTLGRTKRSIHGALAIINVVIMHLRG
jgi:hypothetical protein